MHSPHEVYQNELKSRYKLHGWALWQPEPDPDSPTECVAVGDVGYISNGRFIRMFNVQRTRDDPSHQQHGVPEGYRPMPPSPFNIFQQSRLDRGDYCSGSVRTANAPNRCVIRLFFLPVFELVSSQTSLSVQREGKDRSGVAPPRSCA
jgi:hypothetical protein